MVSPLIGTLRLTSNAPQRHAPKVPCSSTQMHAKSIVRLPKCMQNPDCSAFIVAASGSSGQEAMWTLHEMKWQPIVVRNQAQPAMPKPEQS